MIFKQIDEIFNGYKTQTRRIVKDCERYEVHYEPGYRADRVYHNGRLKWQEGRYYTIVPKRGAKGVGLMRIMDIRKEALQDIIEVDAFAEGVASVEEYKALWNRINTRKGLRWEDNPDVWVITFEVVEDYREANNEV